jgi:hypothetical protein
MFKDFFNLNTPQFWAIIERFLIDMVFLFILIYLVYYRYSRRGNYLFSFFLMGVVIFMIGSMLPIVFSSMFGAQIGMAIGLFAIFTILRFRTRNLRIKDMAYIFTVIAISAVNSFQWPNFPLLGIFILNLIIILTAYILEVLLARNNVLYCSHPIVYENLEMLKPGRRKELIKDVTELTGIDVKKVRIRRVDYRKMVAILDIYYET